MKYPYRFGFVPLGSARGVPMDHVTGPLDKATSDGIKRSGTLPAAFVPDADLTELLTRIGASVDAAGNLHATANVTSVVGETAVVEEHVGGSPGPGRSADPEFRRVVEAHAVDMATAHMKRLGWDEVVPLGKPYDLVCRRLGAEKHVEVKGTTGAGAAVTFTRNEIAHFRTCRHGADLIVVREIQVDRSTDPYQATGGELKHVENYRAPDTDLQVATYDGRIRW